MTTMTTIPSPEAFRAFLPRVDLDHRTKNLCDNVNEYLYKSAHEPSLAGHRIQEHCYKVVPALVKERVKVDLATKKLSGVLFDLNYTGEFLSNLEESIQNSTDTRELVSELASKISAKLS